MASDMPIAPIRVMHIITGLQTGGAETMLLKLLSGQDVMHIKPVVIALGGRGMIADKIESLGITVRSVGMSGSRLSPLAVWRLLKVVREYKPHVIQGWMYHGNLMATVAGFFSPGCVPVLWNIRHSLDDIRREKRMTALIIRLGAKLSFLPRGVIYNSRISAKQHEKLGYVSARTLILPNGFDCELFRPSLEARTLVRHQLGVPDGVRLIGLVARYHPIKDHANFIAAAAKLASTRSDVHFVLVGTRIDEGNRELTEMIDAAGLRDRFHLLGERSDLSQITAALDIATSSSWSEAFPNVIGEAMSCGVPCVVTDVGDSALIVSGAGRVVPPKDSNALAAGWASLLDLNQEQRAILSAAARQRIVENYSLPNIVAQYEVLYADTAGCVCSGSVA